MINFLSKLFLLSFLVTPVVVFAHHHDHEHDHDHYVGSAHHSGKGKVYHDGDYVNFGVDFEANCYDQQNSAWNNVANNVELFIEWLEVFSANYEVANISYTVDLLEVWQKGADYEDKPNPCVGKYKGSQDVTIKLAKLNGQNYLDSEVVQDFFNSLQVAIAPYNYADSSEDYAYVESEVDSAYKGVFEDTADMLRIAAKAKAEEKATLDFRAFLGEDYEGWWYLQRVDFSNKHYDYYDTGSSMKIVAPSPPMGGPSEGEQRLPSVLKLKPLSASAEGNFLFHFKIEKKYNYEN